MAVAATFIAVMAISGFLYFNRNNTVTPATGNEVVATEIEKASTEELDEFIRKNDVAVNTTTAVKNPVAGSSFANFDAAAVAVQVCCSRARSVWQTRGLNRGSETFWSRDGAAGAATSCDCRSEAAAYAKSADNNRIGCIAEPTSAGGV